MMGGILSMLFSSNSKYDINKIEIGYSKDQVKREFGNPSQVTTGSDTTEEWTYDVPFRIYVSIKFGRDGLVTKTYRSG